MSQRKRPRPVPKPQDFDREFRAQVAQMTSGLTPTAFTTAWADWAMHLAQSPAKQGELMSAALQRAGDTWAFALRAMGGAPLSAAEGFSGETDRRFAGADWTKFPYNVYARAYQNSTALMKEAACDVAGVTDYHAQLLEFAVRMMLDASSPANSLATNPELLAQTQAESGQNLVRGVKNWIEELGAVAFVVQRGAVRPARDCRPVACTMGSRRGRPARSQAVHRTSIARRTARRRVSFAGGPPKGARRTSPIGSLRAAKSGLRMSPPGRKQVPGGARRTTATPPIPAVRCLSTVSPITAASATSSRSRRPAHRPLPQSLPQPPHPQQHVLHVAAQLLRLQRLLAHRRVSGQRVHDGDDDLVGQIG